MARGRMHIPGEFHMLTNRCEEGRFFLKPTKKVVQIIAYWFARSVELYGKNLEIYAYCFLCNHFHLLCKDNGGSLAEFMGYFQGNVARELNEHLGRKSAHFWQGHYHDEIVEGYRSFWTQYLYVTANAVKSGLVDRVSEWQGLCSLENAKSGEPVVAVGLNRTRYHNANRGKKKRSKKEFEERYEFRIATPPELRRMTDKERAGELGKMVHTAEIRYASRRDRRPTLGMSRVMKISSLYKPKEPASPVPRRFACDTKEREKERVEQYRGFIAAYKETYEGFRSASLLGRRFYGEWPRGSLPPSCARSVTLTS